MNKWSMTDELARKDKIFRQRKIIRDARYKFHFRESKPDVRIKFCGGKENNRIWGC